MQNDEFISKCLLELKEITGHPEEFLEVNENLSNNIRTKLKELYDFTKNEEVKSSNSNALPELIVKNFDLEQIWQQLELQNEPLLQRALLCVSKSVVQQNQLVFQNVQPEKVRTKEESNEEDNGDAGSSKSEESDAIDFELDENEDDDIGSEDGDVNEPGPSEKPKRKSVVDDNFFSLQEMENFLVSEEKKMDDPDSGNDSEDDESDEGVEDVDLFQPDLEDDDKVRQAKYKDFFVAKEDNRKKEKRNKFLEEISEAEDGDDGEDRTKSTFEQRQERLQRKIEELEEKAISEKPWQLKGEISADNRPQNSLLQEVVEFDLTKRPAPVITEEVNFKLEDIIKQRIKDKTFDSVERKIKPVESIMEYKKKLVLDQEKSKESLAQIYEKEYLEQQSSLDPASEEKEEEEPEAHKEINKLMNDLFSKLDALSNFHFTPKPAVPELKIISNLPAINMEEVAPVSVSDANLLAPEEVKGKPKGDVIGKGERTETDKKRERRKKKLKQKHHAKINAKKEEMASGKKLTKIQEKNLLNKVTKSKNVKKMDESVGSKNIKSSKAFFRQLEDEVKSQIRNKVKVKRKNTNEQSVSAKKMKL